MKEIAEYVCVCQPYSEKLNEEVNEYIRNGWEPLGGVTFRKPGPYGGFAQALVRYVEVRHSLIVGPKGTVVKKGVNDE